MIWLDWNITYELGEAICICFTTNKKAAINAAFVYSDYVMPILLSIPAAAYNRQFLF